MASAAPISADDEFFSAYDWCLNPVLSVEQLCGRLRSEIDQFEASPNGWRRDEVRINLYLLSCAIACTIDDALARRWWSFRRFQRRFPSLAEAAQKIIELPDGIWNYFGRRTTIRWRERFHHCVNRVCDGLIRQINPADGDWQSLRLELLAVLHHVLPRATANQRAIIPESFRCHDLTHFDVLLLTERLAAGLDRNRPILLIGPRTAGAYFAPLAAAWLRSQDFANVQWTTIRPKTGISKGERQRLTELSVNDAQIAVIDDYPNTGNTFNLIGTGLARLKIAPERIAWAYPLHPRILNWTAPAIVRQGRALVAINLDEGHQCRTMTPAAVEHLLRPWFANRGEELLQIQQSERVRAINAGFESDYNKGFHVRFKRVFEIEVRRQNGDNATCRILAKGVGWGWLGYHAFLIGSRLSDFVPQIHGLRDGCLFMEWVDTEEAPLPTRPTAQTNSTRLASMAAYVARRMECLGLNEDPYWARPGYRWTGWDEMLQFLRGFYGSPWGRLKSSALRQRLREFRAPRPTLTDGAMARANWIESGDRLLKVDFEHHNFGGAEADIVDPDYDIAAAVFSHDLHGAAEREFIDAVAEISGDQSIGARVDFYKLFCGCRALDAAAFWVNRETEREAQLARNSEYHAAREFLIGFCAQIAASSSSLRPTCTSWTERLFFLDLDGVFDVETLAFSHTTPAGLAALDLLCASGFSVVPNTGRSIEAVRRFCKSNGLPGGLAEHGSVFFDATTGREIKLVDQAALVQIERCRQAILKMPGVFCDPANRCTVRGYRFSGRHTIALAPGEMEEVLLHEGCDGLVALQSSAETFAIARGVDKGSGMRAVMKLLQLEGAQTFAIGDTALDAPMLELADFSYAPANATPELRRLAAQGKCRILSAPAQRGLWQAVCDAVRQVDKSAVLGRPPTAFRNHDLFEELFAVRDRSAIAKVMSVLKWRSL